MSTAYIKNLVDYNGNIIYPQTKTEAIYNESGETLRTELDAYVKNSTISAFNMLASGWNATNKTYSFEAQYPNASYDIEIELNGDTCTEAQLTAWGNAKILGSATSNIIKALGEKPTIDLPIILTVRER